MHAARDHWWLGIRDAEAVEYKATGGDFQADETDFRRGFEAALATRRAGQSYDEARGRLRRRYLGACDRPAFRRGYERGQAYLRRQEST